MFNWVAKIANLQGTNGDLIEMINPHCCVALSESNVFLLIRSTAN